MGYVGNGANRILDDLVEVGNKIGLSTTQPLADGTGFTEPSSIYGYQRYTIANGDFDPAANGMVKNKRRIRFEECTGSTWGTISYVGIFVSNALAYFAPVTTPQVVSQDQLCKFNPQAFQITVSTN